MTTEASIYSLPSIASAIALAGIREENLKTLHRLTGARTVLRGQELLIDGTPVEVERTIAILQAVRSIWQAGRPVGKVDLWAASESIANGQQEEFSGLQEKILATNRRGEQIRAKTLAQGRYVQAIRSKDLTFCIGPAGTGKTYLAAVIAVQALLKGECERLVLTRPAVEAGEKLGFLPGDLQQKIDPFLRPLYDAMYEFIDADKIPALMEKGTIEVAPLAYMRGRTLSKSFVIVDEAQNTTTAQMKMVLTRLGFGSKMVVTGDVTQTDLPNHQTSGLSLAEKVLKNVEGIAFCYLSASDVVRHPLVERIVTAYEQNESSIGVAAPPTLRSTEE
jgi:phosphate starvation-inducible protein PhoH and related proteins